MIDRNVEFPNRFRMTLVPGTDDIYEVVPAPGDVIAAGDTFSKVNMLPDSIPALLGLKMANPQVKDALNVLANIGNVHVWERVQDGVTDYLTSTDRNAYPDNVTDAQDAYYTLGDVVTGSFYMGIPGNSYQNTYTYSSSLSVSDDGTVSLANPSTATSSQWSPLSTDAINSTLVGKFVQWTCQDPNNLDTKYPFNASPSPIIFIPSDAKITVTTPDSNERFTLSKYQPVTGYAAIPANTTITYLGQLGEPGAKIEVGSYVGTGTYGEDNPNSLTFWFAPKLLIVSTSDGLYTSSYGGFISSFLWHYNVNTVHVNSNSYGSVNYFSVIGTTISWYNESNGNGYASIYQCNENGITYHYIAIG